MSEAAAVAQAITLIAVPLSIFLLVMALREIRAARCDCSAAARKAAEEARLEAERECVERIRRECGLSEEAQLILEKVLRGELILLCRDGSLAQVIGGRVVCVGEVGHGGAAG